MSAAVADPKQEAATSAIAQTLFCTAQRHVILAGESGTGRTTVLYRLVDAVRRSFIIREGATGAVGCE